MGSLWELRVTFRDRDGNEKPAIVHISAATDVAALVSYAQAFEAAASAISNANVVSGVWYYRWRYDTTMPSIQSDVRRKGLLLSRESVAGQHGSLLIPSPRLALPWPVAPNAIPRVIERTGMPTPPALKANVDNLLSLIVRPDGTPMPYTDWIYADLSDQ